MRQRIRLPVSKMTWSFCCLYFRFLPSTTMRQCFCCFSITLIVVHCSINLGNWQENNESMAWAPCGRPKSPPSHLLCTVRCKALEVWPFTCLRTWCFLEHDVSCLPTLLKLSPFLLGNQTYKCVSPNSGVFFPNPRPCSQLPATLGGAIVWQLHDAIKLTKRILSVLSSCCQEGFGCNPSTVEAEKWEDPVFQTSFEQTNRKPRSENVIQWCTAPA